MELISNNFIENINVQILQKNLAILKSILILALIYSVFDVLDWYFAFRNFNPAPKTNYAFYSVYIRPYISLGILCLNTIAIFLNVKANKLIINSIQYEEANKFNEGYTSFFKANMLLLIGTGIAVISIVIRIYLKS